MQGVVLGGAFLGVQRPVDIDEVVGEVPEVLAGFLPVSALQGRDGQVVVVLHLALRIAEAVAPRLVVVAGVRAPPVGVVVDVVVKHRVRIARPADSGALVEPRRTASGRHVCRLAHRPPVRPARIADGPLGLVDVRNGRCGRSKCEDERKRAECGDHEPDSTISHDAPVSRLFGPSMLGWYTPGPSCAKLIRSQGFVPASAER